MDSNQAEKGKLSRKDSGFKNSDNSNSYQSFNEDSSEINQFSTPELSKPKADQLIKKSLTSISKVEIELTFYDAQNNQVLVDYAVGMYFWLQYSQEVTQGLKRRRVVSFFQIFMYNTLSSH